MKSLWEGKRITILGGARQGQAAARWLTRHGAHVCVNDRRSQEQMSSVLVNFADLPIRWVLGSHPLDLLDTTDILCLSGGIPLENPIVVEALRRGIPLTNDTQVFLEAVPCRTIGISGSAGKTTTTALVGQMAKNAYSKGVYVGGNIGDPLLNHLDGMQSGDLAILEISSFQLEQMTISPNIAALLNITPNHLDRHGTMEAYTAAKARLLAFQGGSDIAVLCREDAGSWGLKPFVKGRTVSFGFQKLSPQFDGTFLDGEVICQQDQGEITPLLNCKEIQLRGRHNVMNVLAACAIGYAAGLSTQAMSQAVRNFQGVAHRLEFVRERGGVKWYNDSIATTPERTIAAIRSFDEPIILLLGGRDKNLPWQDLATLVHARVREVILFGEAADKIAAALEQVPGSPAKPVRRCEKLEQAVDLAAQVTQPGDVVLLSPGGTSFDQFADFEERGEAFRKWVWELS